MDKTFLEKRIEEKAKERLEKDYINLVDYMSGNIIASKLKIFHDGKEIPIVNFGKNYGFINKEKENNLAEKYTNLDEVKQEVLKVYIEEETDKVLSELQSIKHLLS